MKNINSRILSLGTIKTATKLPVLTIGLGKVKDLKPVPGVVWRNENGDVVIATKESPDGCIYDQDGIAVARVIGGNVLINGQFDIYVPAAKKVEKLLGNPVKLEDHLDEHQIRELKPLLDAASQLRPSLAPAEYGRKVIIITEDMVGEDGYTECHCPWDPENVFVKLAVGDIFLVEDEAEAKGYRIGSEEFKGTHVLE